MVGLKRFSRFFKASVPPWESSSEEAGLRLPYPQHFLHTHGFTINLDTGEGRNKRSSRATGRQQPPARWEHCNCVYRRRRQSGLFASEAKTLIGASHGTCQEGKCCCSKSQLGLPVPAYHLLLFFIGLDSIMHGLGHSRSCWATAAIFFRKLQQSVGPSCRFPPCTPWKPSKSSSGPVGTHLSIWCLSQRPCPCTTGWWWVLGKSGENTSDFRGRLLCTLS